MSGSENLSIVKGLNSVTNLRNMTVKKLKLNINAHTQPGQILLISSQSYLAETKS